MLHWSDCLPIASVQAAVLRADNTPLKSVYYLHAGSQFQRRAHGNQFFFRALLHRWSGFQIEIARRRRPVIFLLHRREWPRQHGTIGFPATYAWSRSSISLDYFFPPFSHFTFFACPDRVKEVFLIPCPYLCPSN